MIQKAFNEAWSAYPGYVTDTGRQVKGVKSKSLEKFRKVVKGKPEIVDAILSAVKVLANEFENDRHGYLNQPAFQAWLHQRRWEEFDAPPVEALDHDPGCDGTGAIKRDKKIVGWCKCCGGKS